MKFLNKIHLLLHIKESLWGLFWALMILVTLFVNYTLCVDIPEFRYVEF